MIPRTPLTQLPQAMKIVSVRLDDAEFAALSRLSEQLGQTRSQVVKRGIAELARQRIASGLPSGHPNATPFELAESLGLIGAFAGPDNLSETVARRVRKRLRAESAHRR